MAPKFVNLVTRYELFVSFTTFRLKTAIYFTMTRELKVFVHPDFSVGLSFNLLRMKLRQDLSSYNIKIVKYDVKSQAIHHFIKCNIRRLSPLHGTNEYNRIFTFFCRGVPQDVNLPEVDESVSVSFTE